MARVLTNPAESDSLTDVEREFWTHNGYLIVRGLADAAQIKAMREAADDGLARLTEPLEFEADLQYPGAPISRDALGGRTVRRLKQAHSRGFVFTEWIQHPGVVNRLRSMLGPQLVCPLAHHNCIMTKAPRFSSETGWHQDIRYWAYERPDLVSVWLALGDEHLENGCLKLLPGTHQRAIAPRQLDSDLFLRPDLPENAELIATAEAAELRAGDVLFFHCRTFHAAGANQSDKIKFSVVFTYRSLDNAPLPGTRSAALPELLIP